MKSSPRTPSLFNGLVSISAFVGSLTAMACGPTGYELEHEVVAAPSTIERGATVEVIVTAAEPVFALGPANDLVVYLLDGLPVDGDLSSVTLIDYQGDREPPGDIIHSVEAGGDGASVSVQLTVPTSFEASSIVLYVARQLDDPHSNEETDWGATTLALE